MVKNKKRKMLIIIAIILAILICWANLHTLINAHSWVNAGAAVVIVMGIAILLHAVLLFILIRTAIKLPLKEMLFAWGFVIFLYLLPMLVSHFNSIEYRKQGVAKQTAIQRINEGTATLDDFVYLYKDDDERIILESIKQGYRNVAEEVLTAVCDTSSDRIFGNRSLRREYLEKYGREIARKKVLGLWLIEAAGEELSEGVEMLLAAGADINHAGSRQRTPLIAAIQNPEMVRLFLEQGADVNAMDEDGHDALFYAVTYHKMHIEYIESFDKEDDGYGDKMVNIAKLLIAHGANLDRKYRSSDKNQYEPLLFFAKQDSKMAKLLTRHNKIERK
jgi:hypothetical protein